MKIFWTAASVIAIAAIGAWHFRDRLPFLDHAAAPQAAASAGQGQGQRSGAGRQGGGRNGGPATVTTIAAEKAALPMDASATGWAVAADTTSLAPLQAGLVSAISARDGQTVKAGDLILSLDDRIARAAVDKDTANIAADQATLAQAEAAFQRAANLVKQSAESQQVLDQARATRDSAVAKVEADRATLDSDRVTLERMEIRAPYDGRLGDIAVSPGAYLSAGITVTTITRYDPIEVSFRLSQRYLPQLRRGIDTDTRVDADPAATGGEALTGTLRFYDNAVDQASGTVLAKAEFANERGLLWPGQSLNVTVHFAGDDPMIVVPTVAVRPGPKGDFVYTVDDTRHVHVASVQVARANGTSTALASGLSGGEHVIVEGQSELADGQFVVEQFSDNTASLGKMAENAPAAEGSGR